MAERVFLYNHAPHRFPIRQELSAALPSGWEVTDLVPGALEWREAAAAVFHGELPGDGPTVWETLCDPTRETRANQVCVIVSSQPLPEELRVVTHPRGTRFVWQVAQGPRTIEEWRPIVSGFLNPAGLEALVTERQTMPLFLLSAHIVSVCQGSESAMATRYDGRALWDAARDEYARLLPRLREATGDLPEPSELDVDHLHRLFSSDQT